MDESQSEDTDAATTYNCTILPSIDDASSEIYFTLRESQLTCFDNTICDCSRSDLLGSTETNETEFDKVSAELTELALNSPTEAIAVASLTAVSLVLVILLLVLNCVCAVRVRREE